MTYSACRIPPPQPSVQIMGPLDPSAVPQVPELVTPTVPSPPISLGWPQEHTPPPHQLLVFEGPVQKARLTPDIKFQTSRLSTGVSDWNHCVHFSLLFFIIISYYHHLSHRLRINIWRMDGSQTLNRKPQQGL